MSHKLTSKQLKAIYLLAGGATTIEVGEELHLRRETLSRWKHIPEFSAEFERVMGQMRGDMQHRLTQLVEKSISTVRYGISSNHCQPERLKAALSVLKLLGIDQLLAPNAAEQSPDVPK